MCGISGFVSKENFSYKNKIKDCLELMKNRGPDNNDFYYKKIKKLEIGLLHSRLNIIDLKPRSNQPLFFDDYVIIFNGEIYNYLEIRNKLKSKYFFKTQSDTEVLLKAYIEYGENCVNHFIGMWSFVIFDYRKKIFFISRDIFGEKPFYFSNLKNSFIFGSEIKYLQSLNNNLVKLNDGKIKSFLFNGYKSLHKDNESYFKNIKSLEPGTNLILDFDLNLKKKKYYYPQIKIDNKIKYKDATENLKFLLTKSLELRLRADVPISFCLSGGVDSGILASIAKKKFNKNINTFSIIDNDPRYNERKEIDYIIDNLGCKNKKIYLEKRKKHFFKKLKRLTENHDGPISTLSYYLHSFLSEEINKSNFKVAISGTGADEIFSGYYEHFLHYFSDISKKSHFKKELGYWKKGISKFIRNPFLKDPYYYITNRNDRSLVYEKKYGIDNFCHKKKPSVFSEKKFTKSLLRNRMLNELFHETVPIILKHDDLNSMHNSIENRSPYLDKELFEFSCSLPSSFLIRDGFQKKILRDSSKNLLNNRVRLYKQKKGFNASINSLFEFEKKNVDYIFNKNSPINDYVNLAKIKENINFKNIPNHYSKFIFNIITTKIFLERFN